MTFIPGCDCASCTEELRLIIQSVRQSDADRVEYERILVQLLADRGVDLAGKQPSWYDFVDVGLLSKPDEEWGKR